MKKSTPPISLAGSHLDEVRHVCAFFTSDDEEYRVMLPFIKDGLACGHRAINVVNPHQHDEHLHRLRGAGIDAGAAQQSGQLEIKINSDAYLREGGFNQDRMLAVFEQLASGNAPGPYPLSRIVCRMDWVAGDRSRVENVIEFESRVNDVWSRHEDAVICTYHLHQFSGDEIVDIMRTHPLVIIGGILQQNPFYSPPEEFLQEYRQRRAGRSKSPIAGA
jgi:MEDS: MEthanogen/methylotroph, DcmR Sensory domain